MLLGLFALRRMWFALGVVSVVGRAQRPTPYPTWAALVADMLGAAVIALLLSGVDSSRQGVRAFLHSLDFRTRPIPWLWYLTGIGLYPGIVLAGNALWAAFGGVLRVPQASGPWYWLVADAVLFFLYVLVGGGGLEEPGWRGFALPLLQRRFSPLLASLVLAVIWAFWHWPLFWLGYAEGGPLGVLLYAIGTTPLAILLTAIYNRSGGSLPAVVLLHASFNITSVYLMPSALASALWVCLVLAIVVIDRMWVQRPPC
jgi:membrane protease YdiL (CAAX protease family)